MKNEKITIIGLESFDNDDGTRDMSDLLKSFKSNEINTKKLQKEFQKTLSKISTMIAGYKESLDNYEMNEITISLEISAKGKIGLLGSGLTAGGASGLKIKFIKKEQ